MSQNSDDCSCNDYSLLTANTGIATVSVANQNLDGVTGTIATVLTAALKGTIIRSVMIKATQPVTVGMIRLFVQGGGLTSLYKEIPIPVAPTLAATPTPTPIMQTYEMTLEGGLRLQNGYKLLATTQTAQSFNIIAEGLDWKYPVTLPGSCCNYKQVEAATGIATASVANTALDGSGTIATIFQAPATNGSTIRSITIKGLQSTNEGMVRLFIGLDAAHFKLIKEISIPVTKQGGFEPSFKHVVDMEGFSLKATYVLGASTHLAESYAITVDADDWSYPIS